MPTYGISEMMGVQMKDSEGNVIMSFPYSAELTFTRLFSDREKLNPDNIEKVIFNPPATIVIFKDGTKTVVKTHNEEFDPEKGLLMALSKHIWSSRGEFNRLVEKSIKDSNL